MEQSSPSIDQPPDQLIELGEPEGFTSFMGVYPNPTNREEARLWWRRNNMESNLEVRAELMKCLKEQIKLGAFGPEFWPNAGNYLKSRRWKDALVRREKPAQAVQAAPGRSPVNAQEPVQMPIVELSEEEWEAKVARRKALLREGFVQAWKENHPGEEPPADVDPLNVKLRSMPSAGGYGNGTPEDAERRRQAEEQLKSMRRTE